MGDKMKADDEEKDGPMDWIGQFVSRTFRLKPDKWQRLLQGDERIIVNTFLELANIPVITFRMSSAGMIVPQLGWPTTAKSKIIYFLRNEELITSNNYRTAMSAGEVSKQPVAELAALTEHIVGPLLCNPANHTGWPRVLVQDVAKRVGELKNLLYQVRGEMSSQVMLPMPSNIEKIHHAEATLRETEGEEVDLYLKSSIETAIIKWTALINEVLKEESQIVFRRVRFPLPMDDLTFYTSRLKNLEGIYQQLKDPRIKKMAFYLEQTDSVYIESFRTLLTNIVTAIVEVRDIVRYQRPLASHFEGFENYDFAENKKLIRPMFHCVGLLWGRSRYYCSSEKILPLLREMCNLMIQQCASSLDPSSIFQGEPEEQLAKLVKVKDIMELFQSTYEMNRDKIATFFPVEVTPIHWLFDYDIIFDRFNVYMKRLNMIEEMLSTTKDLLVMEKIEIGGLKGKVLSTIVQKAYGEFLKQYGAMGEIEYDPTNPEDDSFVKDYENFINLVETIDRRLATVFSLAMDDSRTTEGLSKLLLIGGELLQRPIIKEVLSPKYERFIDLINEDLDHVKNIFDEGFKMFTTVFERPMVDPFMPPVAGMLLWLKKLENRISTHIERFDKLDDPIANSEAAIYMHVKYEEMMAYLNEFEEVLFERWQSKVNGICKEELSKTMLTQNGGVITMNFSPELACLIRELRYLTFLAKDGIPEEGKKLFDTSKKIQHDLTRLNRAIAWYNHIKCDSHETEVNLIQSEIEQIETLLTYGINDLDWNSDSEAWISQVYDMIDNLQDRVLNAQENVKKVLANIDAWGDQPLFDRKIDPAGGRQLQLDLDAIPDRRKKRLTKIQRSYAEALKTLDINIRLYNDVDVGPDEVSEAEKRVGSLRIHYDCTVDKLQVASMIEEAHALEVEPGAFPPETEGQMTVEEKAEAEEVKRQEKIRKDREQAERDLTVASLKNTTVRWPAYVGHIDSLIANSIIKAMNTSLDYFLNQMNCEIGPNIPFVSIQVELVEPDLVFTPSLEMGDEEGIYGLFESMIDDIYYQGSVFPRIALDIDEANYDREVDDNEEMREKDDDICEEVRSAINELIAYVQKFDCYAYLWLDDRKEVLENFIKYGKFLTLEEIDNLIFESGQGPEEQKPQLAEFQKQIDKYNDMYRECEKLEAEKLFHGWLRLNMVRLKQAFLNLICKWSNLFKQHLAEEVRQNLTDLNDFIKMALKVLDVELTEDDFDKLLGVMDVLGQIKNRPDTEGMLDHVRDTIEVLKIYGVTFEEDVFEQLEILPDKWKNLVKMTVMVKTNINPLIQHHASLISRRVYMTNLRMNQYLAQFKQLPIFFVDCEDVYKQLDEVNVKLAHFEHEMDQLTKSCALFDIQPPDAKLIKGCRRELKMIKQLWDYYFVVQWTIENWKKTLWHKIDVEAMESECRKFSKDLRGLDKELRTLGPFVETEAVIKNLMTSLKAIVELQNPAIKDRHWIELMKATKVKFTLDENTKLVDLLNLNLHLFQEEVKVIIDKSVKEQAMEKTLRELNATWDAMEFEYELHPRSGYIVPKANEELVETLEDNQTQVQGMASSKFVGFFEAEVLEWQKKLSNADQLIGIWFEVQRKWMYLESIFVGSEDIRNQLPEDSARFDDIDSTFKVLLLAIRKTANVIEATNQEGLYERLDALRGDLTLCEKALNDYLETKRLAYPRFYFVSSADLLDILSNGNAPEMVCKHLTKLYDNLAKLVFSASAGKRALEMISKENEEHVTFKEPCCDCSGQVEVWLNRVTECMRATLHELMSQAVVSYEERPRDSWLFDWPAQIALVGTQIWWTTETNQAFYKLEEGHENALKDFQKKQINQLFALITLLLGELTAGDRQKIMTICTIDVHSRDVVAKMIIAKINNSLAFMWQSQLRHRWDTGCGDCFANICDAQFKYDYEYLGNTPRLVITPLTDRCYITLTQSLHLVMGGAPAGPAGTGKTETTKDLGRALGIMVYVFNCSEQMDFKSCGNIYKGLAQTGAWGCFDEFNRITVEVLSVVAVQVKCIQDAVKFKKKRFDFMGEDIILIPTIGLFITMNPGYAGRTELPENLKVLFRPCAMVVPDFELICEIMLVAEGFQDARILARKFITLYTLCKELLSKQDHYDWGLRAIKSVLVVAGSLKRGDRLRPEDQVLMRALRDFNIPKIVTDDVAVFVGLIGDLFPALNVPRKRDPDLEKMCQVAAIDIKLQPEPGFILKIVQLVELFAVRHSVFIDGFAGTGKSCVWKCLYRTYQMMKSRPFYNDLDPKAVSNDELFGVINPATREWKDGLFSVIMRDMANMTGDGPKWIILDGDIDPMWIESLNTLMDDNKVLTLASNERIALNKTMRLLFEISNLRTATPATVSRAGILYINPQDLGWNPMVTSWVDTRLDESEKTLLTILFDKYIPPLLEASKRYKKITPITDLQQIQMVCCLLDCFLVKANVPPECPKEWYEIYFVFSCVWSFGSALFQDQLIDWRNEFHKWFTNEFKSIKFPTTGTVFSSYLDHETKKFMPWSDLVPEYEFDPDLPLQQTLVTTQETIRIKYFMDLLLPIKHPVMLIGGAGSGKSVIVADKLNGLSENYSVTNVPFNFYTTSEMLQKVLEKPLEKKSGRNFGPPGTKTMVYFVDDMNMPEVDTYGTVQPHTLIRQFFDYQHWYDRAKLTLKDILNCQFVSGMNPTAGSFTIDPRLQRHFCVFAVSFPSTETCFTIYQQILSQHMSIQSNSYSLGVQRSCDNVVNCALAFHAQLSAVFLPTAAKFHYVFNMRDIANIFQGMLFTSGAAVPTPSDLLRVWTHEATRVYCDKMVDAADQDLFSKIMFEVIKRTFPEADDRIISARPLIYCHFADGIGEPKYLPIKAWPQLIKLLDEALASYNDTVSSMNLVLFEDAMFHICRINRILEAPRGNALLVGVGGSGKQSLSRLASFISSLEVFQVQLKKGYAIPDLKLDISALYLKAGLKSVGCVFLMTDAQVAEEKFLVLINDLLTSGEIPELFPDEDIENICNGVKGDAKQAGYQETKDQCWKFFINRVRSQLKVVLCFSPVGATLRIRARKFPAVVNCTAINWFHEWPEAALLSVSNRFLSSLEALPIELKESVGQFMSTVHISVNEMSKTFFENERRYNYTTPKSFLEQIGLYSKLLTQKTAALKLHIMRLENGLTKLEACSRDVAGLKFTLADQEIVLKVKNKAAQELIEVVGAESENVGKEKAFAAEEEKKVRVFEEDVSIKAKICADDLAKAEPALLAAQEALNTLNKNNLTELKSFGSPPDAVVNVSAAVLVLFSKKGIIPKDRSWKACKTIMAKVDQFLNDLVYYDKENIHPDVVKTVKGYLADPGFTYGNIVAKSAAAAGLCLWVINIIRFYDVYVVVEPKRRALSQANAELAAARSKLADLKAQISFLEEKLGVLMAEFHDAVNEKLKCQAEADSTNATIDLANRLVNGLASENVRWRVTVGSLKDSGVTLPGDVLLITAFISYVGCFMRRYRLELLNKKWLPELARCDPRIPSTLNLDPLMMLTDDAQIATWNNEGLPTDRMSTENATILTNSARWPLMIDPQLQGIKWIKTRYGDKLVVLRLSFRNCLELLEKAIVNGDVVLLENIGETVDAVLDPLLGRMLIRKGLGIKIGDKDVDFNDKFRLILQTKLANPHYQPEMQAQCTLINFTVTKDGLEEQLLGEVVLAERPDLAALRADLTKQQNDFKITLKSLEDDLLRRLSSAGPDILSDASLVVNLETTKKTAAEIEIKVKEAKLTTVKIDVARENYRMAATRGSILYFILNDLSLVNPMYQFSLKAFTVVFLKALHTADAAETVEKRVQNLLESVTFDVFMYTSRALFEEDKLIFLLQLTIQILLNIKEIPAEELDFLLRYAVAPVESPFNWLSDRCWGGIVFLSKMDEFSNLDKDMEGASKRWQKFTEAEAPERDKFPGEWRNKTPMQRLCMMRALRPDRMTYASRFYIEEKMGVRFTEARPLPFEKSFGETNSTTLVFFILSPGVDPLKDVEKAGRRMGFTTDHRNFHSVSLGQGQEVVAEHAMDIASEHGHWVILQNVHLVARWLSTLEKKMELCNENAHEKYRLFVSAEPAASKDSHIMPQGILESAIKITNEPPTGMWANLHKSLDNFNQETLEMCTKESEFKAILFALCYFHAVVCERRKFGPQGWNRNYPFNFGDLTISVYVLYNYLEANARVPWEDLRYLFGEIMYGGHITDDWDRRLCKTYLMEFMQPELVDGELYLAQGFLGPPSSDFVAYHQYVDELLPGETPYLYGLHPNAEIGFLTTVSEKLFVTLFEMQPRDTGSSSGGGVSREEMVKQSLDDILDRVPEPFNMIELMGKVEERTPFIIVAFQECERMNILMGEMRRTLKELELGLKGELTTTSDMEKLEQCLFMDKVPPAWEKRAYPSLLGLSAWFLDLCRRLVELENWSGDFSLPPAVWLAGFFNPQSFLTAIMQQTARKNEWPLDKMCLNCDVTKKWREEFTAPPREGAYIHGLFMEGARWDTTAGCIVESRLKELFPLVPVIYIKAVTQDKQEVKGVYECPVYKIRMRGPTYVWTFNLKTKEKPAKWVLGGVCLLLGV